MLKNPLYRMNSRKGHIKKLEPIFSLSKGKLPSHNRLLQPIFESDYLSDMRSETVIQKLKVHMSPNDTCDVCISDNGSQHSSQQFADFAKEWEFIHKTSSPLHPISNGLSGDRIHR